MDRLKLKCKWGVLLDGTILHFNYDDCYPSNP